MVGLKAIGKDARDHDATRMGTGRRGAYVDAILGLPQPLPTLLPS